MDQSPNQGHNNGESPASLPTKRKRGRPRKEHSGDRKHRGNRRENIPVPPGFERVKETKALQVHRPTNPNSDVVGQVVSGVVEAAFDAGFLVNVRVGNSDVSLRGVVFKPGHFVPVSAENDVAPDAQMIKRTEIPIPVGTRGQLRGQTPRPPKQKNDHHSANDMPSNNALQIVPSKARHVPSVPALPAPPVQGRGTIVPVILQPVNLENGTSHAKQPDHLSASKGKQVPVGPTESVHQSNGTIPATNQVTKAAHQMGPSQRATPKVNPTGNSLSVEVPSDMLQELGARIMDMPPGMEQLCEIAKTKRVSPPLNDSASTQQREAGDIQSPLSIQPLQFLQPSNKSASGPKSLDDKNQGNATQNPGSRFQNLAPPVRVKVDEP